MPLTDDGYDPSSSDDLYDEAEDIHTEIDPNAHTGQGTVRRAMLRTMAQLLADHQEITLDELYDSGYIETAEGEHLDRRTADIGITRREAQPATGVVEFFRESETSSEYLISKGTLVETAGSNPVTFETTEKTTLGLVDGFEDGSLDASWSGNTGDVSVVNGSAAADPDPNDGSYHLRVDAVSDSLVYDDSVTISDGTTMHYSVYPQSNTATDCVFFLQPTNTDSYYTVTVDASSNVLSINKVEDGTESQLDSVSVTIPTDAWLTVEIDTTVNTDTETTLYDSNGDVVEDVTTSDSTFTSGHIGVRSGDANNPKYIDTIVRMATAASIEGTAGGEQTNVGPRTVTVMPSPPTGVGEVINPVPTGDPIYTDTSGDALLIGTDRETDDELRERALDSTAIGGAATVPAVAQALWGLDGVISVTVFENDTLNDNTGSGGLPPVSIEPVIFGGDDDEIAQTLFDTIAATERLYSGAHGTSNTKTIESDILAEDETVEWSDPPRNDIDVTLDIVHDETYVGDEDIKRIVVEYVGGTLPDGSTATGTGIGENIRLDAIRDRVVGPDTGVKGISSYVIDKDDDGTDDTTTDANGLTVLDVASDTVAETDATDGSVTINTSQV